MMEYLSYSSISYFLNCPRQFKFRFIDKLPAIVRGVVILGSAYHETLKFGFQNKLHGTQVHEDELCDFFNDAFEHQVSLKVNDDFEREPELEIERIEWDEDREKIKGEGIALTRVYYRSLFNKIEPLLIEEELRTVIDEEIEFIGHPDLITVDGLVIDHKVRQRSMSFDEAGKHLQPSAYALLLGREIEMQFHIALKHSLMLEVRSTRRGKNEIEWFKELVRDIWRQIKSGVFPPNPHSNICSPKYCSYWYVCRMPKDF